MGNLPWWHSNNPQATFIRYQGSSLLYTLFQYLAVTTDSKPWTCGFSDHFVKKTPRHDNELNPAQLHKPTTEQDNRYPISFCLYLSSLILYRKVLVTPDGVMEIIFQMPSSIFNFFWYFLRGVGWWGKALILFLLLLTRSLTQPIGF